MPDDSFPTSPETSRALAFELIDFLKEKIENTTQRREWSNRNFDLLRQFSDKKSAVSLPSAPGTPSSDRKALFLWDFVAYIDGKGLLIVAESEHESDIRGLQHDFEKLLYVRSPVKLFMCRMETEEDHIGTLDDLFEYMRSVCSIYSAGEVFIVYFVWWSLEDRQNRDRAYWLQIDSTSADHPLSGKSFVRR